MKVGSVDVSSYSASVVKINGPVAQNQSIRVNGAPMRPGPEPEVAGIAPDVAGKVPVAGTDKAENSKDAQYGESSVVKRQAGGEVAEKGTGGQLSRQELAQLTALKQRDRAVRSHEQAHRAAGAGLVSGATSYSYQRGPDGRRYAVGGEVHIDTSTESTPRATIIKMSKIKRAALAPTDPSAQDQRVAAAADKIMARARQELHADNNTGLEADRPSVDLVV